ncbi:MAG: hypothetical protein ACRDTS_18935, partial [Mycobacterium sp.]
TVTIRKRFAATNNCCGHFSLASSIRAQGFAASFAPRNWPGVWARNRLSRLLSLRYVGDWIIRAQLRDDFELADYAFTPPTAPPAQN